MSNLAINLSISQGRMLGRIRELGSLGRDAQGRLVRVAASDMDRMGAGHDAQMIARIAPSAMIFVPSRGGISHNPAEYAADEALVSEANILLGVTARLAAADYGAAHPLGRAKDVVAL